MAIQSNFPNLRPSLLLDFASTKQLDSRITYTRASTATFYNGVTTAKAEENLLTYSQTFSNAIWTGSLSGATFSTTTATAPDATSTAATLLASASSAGHSTAWTYSSYAAGTYTLSFFIQAGTNNFASIYFSTGSLSNAICTVNLSTGAVTQTGSNSSITYVSSSITLVTGTWYRVSLTATLASTLSLVAGIQMNNSATPTYVNGGPQTWTAAGTETINIWGAQLEIRSALSAYTATTTQAITNYIPVLQTAASGVARFDNNPTTGESLGLLIEESRSNSLTYSSQFDNAVWTKGNATVTADTVVAPDGTLTADGLIEATSSTPKFAYQGLTLTAASYTLSVYARRSTGSQRWLSLYPQGTGVTASATYDVNSGAVTTTGGAQYLSSTITAVGNNWYRCTLTFTGAAVSVINVIYLSNASNTAAPTYTGDGFSGLYLWGAQLELGAFATSYIPTVASQVTRAADAASMTGANFSSWYNNSEGTFLFNATTASVANRGLLYATNGTSSQSIFAYGSGNNLVFSGVYGGTTQFAINQNPNSLNNISAIAYKVNDFAATSNGASVSTDTSGNVPIGLSQIQIGYLTNSSDQNINGTIKKIAYYPLRVTNAQLQALTS